MSCWFRVQLADPGGLTGGVNVLVVDDEPSIVDAVATALRYEGYDVAEAPNGPSRAVGGADGQRST